MYHLEIRVKECYKNVGTNLQKHSTSHAGVNTNCVVYKSEKFSIQLKQTKVLDPRTVELT